MRIRCAAVDIGEIAAVAGGIAGQERVTGDFGVRADQKIGQGALAGASA